MANDVKREGDGKVAVVTGACRGMGLAISKKLGSMGYRIVMTDILADEVAAASASMNANGFDTTPLKLDVGNEEDRSSFRQRLGDVDFDRIAVLVNNAGISPKQPGDKKAARPSQVSLDEWNWVMDVNITGPFRMSQICLPPMRKAGWGRIVNISSRGGRTPANVAGVHYVVTKTGILGLTRSFAKEVAPEGITVNSVCPGRITGAMTDGSPPELIESLKGNIPVNRFGEPEDIGALVGFLASRDAGFITGAIHDINGGSLMI
ncbi:SDR family NAD(P)-dependent oxidoreductase [Pseudooceanicola sp.]|uniref:SDR family NAD(P)-dependent oxidoreductase n=1 Tax=Pseudooceanicola sp. TaxID=1914328 RepID=UPI00261BB6A0|nr:SDR family NAD(P)-dependent oxidoreductase [Pseudooceanicola sp.]MDF1857159.1 SDR family NAD(P)-dependent oxidoreductase [Pseudooceanicola sp.]